MIFRLVVLFALASVLLLAKEQPLPGLVRVTAPVEDSRPPTTLDGLNVSEERVGSGGGAGVTMSEADLVAPLSVAEMVTVTDAGTALVPTVNVALVAPAATVTLEGTWAAAAVAGPLNVTMPVEEFPPVTLVGFNESAKRESEEGTEESSKSNTAGLGSFSETATNFEGEII